MPEIYTMPQLSESWFAIKMGKIGASSMGKVLMGGGKTRKSYMLKLAAERLTGERIETYSNAAMERGVELEPEARRDYEFIRDVDVVQVGWVERNNDIGCSPDGMVGDNGLVEIKCPLATTCIEYHTHPQGWIPPEYRSQLQAQLWVCEKEWVDFFVYHPKLKPLLLKVERNEEYIKNLAAETKAFLDDLEKLVRQLRYDA